MYFTYSKIELGQFEIESEGRKYILFLYQEQINGPLYYHLKSKIKGDFYDTKDQYWVVLWKITKDMKRQRQEKFSLVKPFPKKLRLNWLGYIFLIIFLWGLYEIFMN